MPAGRDPYGGSSDAPPRSGFAARIPFLRARSEREPDSRPLGEKLRGALLKPPKPGSAPVEKPRRTVEELEDAVRRTDDKERAFGLIAAPIAAGLGFLVIDALISNDPSAKLADGLSNKLHVSVTLYHELLFVLLALSVAMLVTAMLRKRLYLGMVMALYGLAIFNLHYWGFGIPYIICAAWLLVRSYRLQRDLREARGEQPRYGPRTSRYDTTTTTRRKRNSRYTPATSSRSRASRAKPVVKKSAT